MARGTIRRYVEPAIAAVLAGRDAGFRAALVPRGCRATQAPRPGRAHPIQVFDQAETGTLTPLPAAAFTLAEWSRAKVAPDVHVKYGKVLCSVRPNKRPKAPATTK